MFVKNPKPQSSRGQKSARKINNRGMKTKA